MQMQLRTGLKGALKDLIVRDPNSVGTRNINLLLPDITESTAESRLTNNLNGSPRK